MNIRSRIALLSSLLVGVGCAAWAVAVEPAASRIIRAGVIGLDSPHVIEFARLLNNPRAVGELAGVRIVAAYPGGSRDMPASWDHVAGYVEAVGKLNVEIVGSIDELLGRVDVVMLMSVDGRAHLAQARPTIAAGRPLFIDTPMAASLADAMRIFRMVKERGVPCFSASPLRFTSSTQAARSGRRYGRVRSCTAWSPMLLEPHHPDLFWRGIHGVETLYTVMGTGCERVERAATNKVIGQWNGGRCGVFVERDGYGAEVEGGEGGGVVGKYEGCLPLVIEIVRFFKTGQPPVGAEETLEILAFMEAADESKRYKGAPVTIESVVLRAERSLAKEQRSKGVPKPPKMVPGVR